MDAVLGGECATTVHDRAFVLEPACGALAADLARRGQFAPAVEWLRRRAALREELARGLPFLVDARAREAAPPAPGTPALLAPARGRGRESTEALRARRQAADAAQFLEMAEAALARRQLPAAAALLRLAAEQPVTVDLGRGGGGWRERPPVLSEARLAGFAQRAGAAGSLDAAEVAWGALRASLAEAAAQAALRGGGGGGGGEARAPGQHAAGGGAPAPAAAPPAPPLPPAPSPHSHRAMIAAALHCLAFDRAWEVAAALAAAHGAADPAAASAFGGLAPFAEALDTEAKVHAAFTWIEAQRVRGGLQVGPPPSSRPGLDCLRPRSLPSSAHPGPRPAPARPPAARRSRPSPCPRRS